MTHGLNSTWYDLLRTVSEHIELAKIVPGTRIETVSPQVPSGREIFLKDRQRAKIRPAFEGDLPGIGPLIAELGYARDDAMILRRLMSLAKSASDLVLVVESEKGLLGWMQVSDRETLESGKRLEIVGLVVAESARRCGVASALLREAARIASHRGREVAVRTNILREEARAFYTSVGFKEVKVQRVFICGPEDLLSK